MNEKSTLAKITSHFAKVMNGDPNNQEGSGTRLTLSIITMAIVSLFSMALYPFITQKLGIEPNIPTYLSTIFTPIIIGALESARQGIRSDNKI